MEAPKIRRDPTAVVAGDLEGPAQLEGEGDKSEGGLAAENVLKRYGKMLLSSWLEFVYPSIGSWCTTGGQNNM